VTQQHADQDGTSAISQDLPAEPAADGEGKAAARLDPGFKRNLAIIGGVFVAAAIVVFILLAMRSGGDKNDNGGVRVSLPQGTTDNGGDQPMSPAMQDALRKKQLAEQAAARDRGDQLFIPKDTTQAPVPIEARQSAINPVIPSSQPVPAVQSNEEDRARSDRRRQGMERQIGSLLAMSDTGAAAPQRVTFERAAAAPGARAEPTAPAPGASAVARRGPPIAEGLEIVPGETASPIDTYRTKYASARIVSGKLAGAFLTGKTELLEEGLSTTYTMMRVNGKTYHVDAIALDEKTSTDAMEANVDRRYLQRYVMPVAAAFVGGFAAAAAQTGTQSTLTAGGILATTPSPTSTQARNAGIAAGVNIAQREVEKEANKPYRATLPANTPIGIMFRAEVQEIVSR